MRFFNLHFFGFNFIKNINSIIKFIINIFRIFEKNFSIEKLIQKLNNG